MLVLEDIAISTTPAWDIAVVVIVGVVQGEVGIFRLAGLDGITGIQTPGGLFQAVCGAGAAGCRFGIPGIDVGGSDGKAGQLPFGQIIADTGKQRVFPVGIEVGAVVPPHIKTTVRRGIARCHTLQEEALVPWRMDAGTFHTERQLVDSVAEGDGLQPGQPVVQVIPITLRM